jgi:hypothetical protein
MTARKLSVLIVDDEPGDGLTLAGEFGDGVRASVSGPEDVEIEDVLQADLILVDFDLGTWPTSAGTIPARQPRDGLALTSVLRSAWQSSLTGSRPLAFALYSAQLKPLSGGLSDDVREHAIARLNNLEWVFSKKDLPGHPPLASRVTGLADAVRRLPDPWPAVPSRYEALQALLGFADAQIAAEACWQDVLACRPPVNELAQASRGLAVLRWLGHRVLPYPCFLSDQRAVAVRLGVESSALGDVLRDPENALTVALGQVRYQGVLGDLLGPRWWRAGVESLAWGWQEGTSDRSRVTSAASALAGRDLPAIAVAHPVLAIDATYAPLSAPVDVGDAVRVAPDDWPPYADQAWMEKQRVRRSQRLRSLVLPEDGDLVGGTSK